MYKRGLALARVVIVGVAELARDGDELWARRA